MSRYSYSRLQETDYDATWFRLQIDFVIKLSFRQNGFR